MKQNTVRRLRKYLAPPKAKANTLLAGMYRGEHANGTTLTLILYRL